MPTIKLNAWARMAAALASALTVAAGTTQASAQSPLGVWIDHTGRGAVEITECGGGLCGHVVWVKDAKHKNTCRNQILGNVKPVGTNTWDRGWIVDPDDNSRYSVELKPIGADRLRVVGYMGSKMFSETMTWKRAPADLQRCDGKDVREVKAPPAPAPIPAPPPATVATPAAPIPVTEAKPAALQPPPAFAPPGLVSPQLPPVTVLPPQQSTAAGPTAPAVPAIAEPVPEQTPATKRAQRSKVAGTSEAPPRKRRQANRTCTLDLPYLTVAYPCSVF